MSEEPAKSEQVAVEAESAPPARRMHWSGRAVLALCALLLAALLGAMAVLRYVQSAEFHERARRYLITRIELATGGKVELRRVSWVLDRLEFELSGLTIHGREAAGAPPLLQVDSVHGKLSWSSLLPWELSLRELTVLHPMARIETYRDGSTNLPEPKLPHKMQASEELLRLAIGRAELSGGTLQWDAEKIGLNGRADGVALRLAYRRAGLSEGSYEGQARVSSVKLQLAGYRPMDLAAETRFRLHRDRLEVSQLEIRESSTRIQASGEVSNFTSPVARFSYSAQGELGELARLVHVPELRRGAMQVDGTGSYAQQSGELLLAGRGRASGASWVNQTLSMEKINGGFEYAFDGERLNVSSIFLTALGGAFHGQMTVTGLRGKEPAGEIALQAENVELSDVLRSFSRSDLPLDRLHLSGAVYGPLRAQWRGSPEDARLMAELRVEPRPRAGELPVSATARAAVELRDDSVEIESMEASTPATKLTVRGRLATESNLHLELSSSRLAEVEPLVTSWRGSRTQPLPVEFGGGARFQGTVRGNLRHPAFNGHVMIEDFTTVVHTTGKTTEGAANARVVREHWDQFEGDVEFSPAHESLHNGVLRSGSARIAVDASLPLLNGSYDTGQPFSAHVKLDEVPVTELQGAVGSTYPVTGMVSGEVQVSGTASRLSGSGSIAMRNGTAWGQSLRSATARVNFTEDEAQLRNIVVSSDLMQLTGEARMNVQSREFAFDLKGSEMKLEKLRPVREGTVHAAGVAAFEVKGSGTPSAPVLNGKLHLRNLSLNQQMLGEMSIEAATQGTEMTLTARSNFRNLDVKLDGHVHLRDQMPMQLSADVQSSNLTPLLESFLPVRHGGAAELKMHIDASGEAMHPRAMTATVTIDRWAAMYGGIHVTNDGPVRLRMANETLRIEQFHLASEQETRFLEVRGEVQLGGKREIDLHANGNMDLRVLQTVDQNLTASGAANLNLQINGTLERPRMHGGLRVQNAAIAYTDFPNALSDVYGTLIFSEDRLQVQELTARTGGGLLRCTGFIVYSPAQGLGFNLSVSGHDIRLRYPEGLSSTADAGVTITGSMKSAVLAGDIKVTRIALNPQFDFASYLVKGKRVASATRIESPLNNVRLDLHVTSTPELEVQTTLARLSGNVDVRVRGTAARPSMLGRVNLLEGAMDFNGTKYRIERGDITYTNPVRIDPTLDVELTARVRDYDITLGFHGSLDKLTPTYRSDPPLASSDIISLLALGRTAEEQANPAMMGSAQYQPSVSESASNALIGQALNATVSSRVQRLFGVSRLKIDPNVGGTTSAGLARVTVEQQVSKDLTVTYITNLNQSAQQIIQIEYNLSSNVSVVGVRDQTGVLSIDFLLRKRKK
jgi:translocation and assembly module TamB